MDQRNRSNEKQVTADSQQEHDEIKVAGSSVVMDQQSNAVTDTS